LKKILIATDAWNPQINGVVRSLQATAKQLQLNGYQVEFVTPSDFDGFEWPFYQDIKICFPNKKIIESKFKNFNPDIVHIATEGSVGLYVRKFCKQHKIKYTTSYHTRFPEFLKKMYHIPLWLSYRYFKWFHSQSKCVLVPTTSMIEIMKKRGFKNLELWNRGVDLDTFKPHPKTFRIKKPVLMYVGRVSIEKNIQDFMNLQTDGTKVVVGDGPELPMLKKQHPSVIFAGFKQGEELAYWYSQADVMIFPSRSDTYGLVLLEALACGVPFAAYNEPGPLDIACSNIELSKHCCFVGENLADTVERALKYGNSEDCLKMANTFSWKNCTQKFIAALNK
jgi:glycosyltransferase involved in cell wall biosynthesis